MVEVPEVVEVVAEKTKNYPNLYFNYKFKCVECGTETAFSDFRHKIAIIEGRLVWVPIPTAVKCINCNTLHIVYPPL